MKSGKIGAMFFVADFNLDDGAALEKHLDKLRPVIEEATAELERGQQALLKKYGKETYSVAMMLCNSGRIQRMLHRNNVPQPILELLEQHHIQMTSVIVSGFRVDPDVVAKLAEGINEHQELMQQQVSEHINELLKQESKA